MSIKRVFERITKNEVELSREQVDLALADDFESAHKKALGAGMKTGAFLNDIGSSIDKAKAMIKDAIKLHVNVASLGRRIEDGAKELGVPVPKDITKKIDGAKQWEDELEDLLSLLNKVNLK